MTPTGRRRQQAFALLALLIFIAILGLVGMSAVKIGTLTDRREAEEQLLYVGTQYRRALQLYVDGTPPGQPRFPPTLTALLRDPRYPQPRRYLRALYPDPITKRNDWALLLSPEGGVMGLHSRSEQEPIRQTNFSPPFEHFNRLKKYSDWVFYYLPDATPQNPLQPALPTPAK
ncbi:type II secretion system protein [Cupriavidus sp. SIMBA_020]|uniref:type II secretion system protein n=1 Tax=Cupriavidus sp. SIMBA_020 TaxID=3085766 RepID=UPI00397CEFDF